MKKIKLFLIIILMFLFIFSSWDIYAANQLERARITKFGYDPGKIFTGLKSPLSANISIESVKASDYSWTENNNGKADPGENINLIVCLVNSGQSVSDVSTVLRTKDPFVSITVSEIIFPELEHGEVVSATYSFVVSENFASDHDILFELVIKYNEHQQIEKIPVAGYWREVYVNSENETGPWDGTQGHPYQKIQDAIDFAYPAKVRVARGFYEENIVMSKNLYICGGKNIYGGYDPDNWARDIQANETIIDGAQRDSVIVVTKGSPVISGFIVQNGSGGWEEGGGGILCQSLSHPLITNNTIVNNTARLGGGIQCLWYSFPRVIKNVIDNNSATCGGGIHCFHYCRAVIDNNFITNNFAIWRGGGISCYDFAQAFIINNVIADNSCSDLGGGVESFCHCEISLINNIITGNSADKGGGIRCSGDYLNLYNNTITNNQAKNGGGIHFDSFMMSITNSILWDNTPDEIYVDSGSLDVTYSDIEGGWEGEGNINIDPLFIDALTKDFHLIYGSPCIDRGKSAGAPEVDFEGETRPNGDRIDIGADEWKFFDEDKDEMGDYWERHYFGNLNQKPDVDYDRDGNYNLEEYRRRTDPTDNTSFPYYILNKGDYNGDDVSDIAVFRPSDSLWAVKKLGRVYFGDQGDIPVNGDYNADKYTDVAIFRPPTGLWAIKNYTRLYHGNPNDIPVPSDYDGDGSCDIAVFSDGVWDLKNITKIYFGTSGDLPVPQDYDGNGCSEIAMFRPSSGLWAIRELTRFYYGEQGDIPVTGVYRWDGSGLKKSHWKSQIAIFRSSTGLWAVKGNTRFYYGRRGDRPIMSDFDGNALDEVGIFRASAGLWAIRNFTRCYFGTSGDLPATK